MSTLGPEAVVQQTQLTPPNVSLIKAAIAVQEAEERWINGYKYVPEGCGDSDLFDLCDNDPTDGFEKSVIARSPEITGTPVGVVAQDTCTTYQWQVADYQARATRMLMATESFQVAQELWEGTSGLNVFLTQPGLATVAGTSVKPLDVTGVLEKAFFAASPAVRPMIHMSPRFLERLLSQSSGNALHREGDVYYTWMDSVVAVDKGYTGTGPLSGGNHAAGEWVYITSIVTIRESSLSIIPSNMTEATLRTQNQVTFFAEKAISATFDYNCQVYAVSVDLT